MKIDKHHHIIGKKIYEDLKKTKGQEAEEDKNVSQKKDTFTMSEEAKIIQKYLNEIKDLEGAREEKIKSLTDKIKSGEYKIDTELLAEKMLEIDED
ncbi:MAG: flagellar biosynthesis anti-sigma factor FlgM [Firmicutes bacterium HGW-Firmicutes-13]|nr:MAG: flagellar biosynthesis anti-sigma factor FlgM [Firmicutes bacterium HGW-Firmicutes-13]